MKSVGFVAVCFVGIFLASATADELGDLVGHLLTATDPDDESDKIVSSDIETMVSTLGSAFAPADVESVTNALNSDRIDGLESSRLAVFFTPVFEAVFDKLNKNQDDKITKEEVLSFFKSTQTTLTPELEKAVNDLFSDTSEYTKEQFVEHCASGMVENLGGEMPSTTTTTTTTTTTDDDDKQDKQDDEDDKPDDDDQDKQQQDDDDKPDDDDKNKQDDDDSKEDEDDKQQQQKPTKKGSGFFAGPKNLLSKLKFWKSKKSVVSELDELIERIFIALDADGDGNLEPQEFVAAISHLGVDTASQHVTDLFVAFDENDDGSLQIDELEAFLDHFYGTVFDHIQKKDKDKVTREEIVVFLKDNGVVVPDSDMYEDSMSKDIFILNSIRALAKKLENPETETQTDRDDVDDDNNSNNNKQTTTTAVTTETQTDKDDIDDDDNNNNNNNNKQTTTATTTETQTDKDGIDDDDNNNNNKQTTTTATTTQTNNDDDDDKQTTTDPQQQQKQKPQKEDSSEDSTDSNVDVPEQSTEDEDSDIHREDSSPEDAGRGKELPEDSVVANDDDSAASSGISTAAREAINELFNDLDVDASKELSTKELRFFVSTTDKVMFALPSAQVQHAVQTAMKHSTKKGMMSEREFEGSIVAWAHLFFQQVDVAQDGTISHGEVESFLRKSRIPINEGTVGWFMGNSKKEITEEEFLLNFVHNAISRVAEHRTLSTHPQLLNLIDTLFTTFDADHSGELDENEMTKLTDSLAVAFGAEPSKDLRKTTEMMKLFDTDGNGVVDVEEFRAYWLSELHFLFRMMDTDRSGAIDRQEFVLFHSNLGSEVSESLVDNIFGLKSELKFTDFAVMSLSATLETLGVEIQPDTATTEQQHQTLDPKCCDAFTVTGLENTIQGSLMGFYDFIGDGKYQQRNGKNVLYPLNGDRYLIGETVGEDECGVFFLENQLCVPHTTTQISGNWWSSETFSPAPLAISCLSDKAISEGGPKEETSISFAQFVNVLDPESRKIGSPKTHMTPEIIAKGFDISMEKASDLLARDHLDRNHDGKIEALELATNWDKDKSGLLTHNELLYGVFLTERHMEVAHNLFSKAA